MKKTIIINGKEYIDISKRENIYTILGGLAVLGGLAFLLVGTFGTILLPLL